MTTPYVSQTQYGKDEAFQLQVARGQVQGHISVQFSGFNPDVDTTWEPIWSDGALVIPSAATVMEISSSNAADTASGAGARTVVLTGLDANYNVITETITLNGQTAVSTTQAFFRINGFRVETAGVNATASGVIYAGSGAVVGGVPATIYDQIPLGWNARQTAVYTIPAGYTGYVSYSRLTFAQVSGTTAVWGRLTTTNANNIKTATVAAVANNGVIEFNPVYPVAVPEKTTIIAESMGDAANNYASTIVQLVLIKNSMGY